jgi:hypothetical protein
LATASQPTDQQSQITSGDLDVALSAAPEALIRGQSMLSVRNIAPRPRRPGALAALALALLSVTAAAASEALPLRGVTRTQLAPEALASFTIDLPAGASLTLKARGSGGAPDLVLLSPDGELLSTSATTRGRMVVLRGFVAGTSGAHVIQLTDPGVGGRLVISTRTSWPRRGLAALEVGGASVPLLSPGPAVPTSLVVKAKAGALDGALELLALVGPDGAPVDLPAGAVSVSRSGRVLRVGPVSLPGGVLHALVGGTPMPGTPVPDLEFRQGLRFSRGARLR